MPDLSTALPTPPRRFRFGLRSLFVVVTVVALLSALAADRLEWNRKREEIIKLLRETNAHSGLRESPRAKQK